MPLLTMLSTLRVTGADDIEMNAMPSSGDELGDSISWASSSHSDFQPSISGIEHQEPVMRDGVLPILDFPEEVILILLRHLNVASINRLKLTSHYFYDLIRKEDIWRLEDGYRFELMRTMWGICSLPCYRCMRILPHEAFDNHQPGPNLRITSVPGIDRYPLDNTQRACAECLLKTNTMLPGSRFKRNDIDFVLCTRCLKVAVPSSDPETAYHDHCYTCKLKVNLDTTQSLQARDDESLEAKRLRSQQRRFCSAITATMFQVFFAFFGISIGIRNAVGYPDLQYNGDWRMLITLLVWVSLVSCPACDCHALTRPQSSWSSATITTWLLLLCFQGRIFRGRRVSTRKLWSERLRMAMRADVITSKVPPFHFWNSEY